MNASGNARPPSFALIRIAQFLVGVMLAWAIAYAWLGNDAPLIAVGVITLAVHGMSWRVRGQIRGAWLTALGLCGALSRVDPVLTTSALGDLRLPVIVGGSLVAIIYGLSVEEPERLRNLIRRTR